MLSRAKGGRAALSYDLAFAYGETATADGQHEESGGPTCCTARQTVLRNAAERVPVSNGRAVKLCRRPAFAKDRRRRTATLVLKGTALLSPLAVSAVVKNNEVRAFGRTKRVADVL